MRLSGAASKILQWMMMMPALLLASLSADAAIISREGWGARPPLLDGKLHHVRGIILHHTGQRSDLLKSVERKMRGLQAFAQRPTSGWIDVPYHYYIAADGRVAAGRRVDWVGETNTRYDPTGYLQVALEGNFEEEHPSREQRESLRELLLVLLKRHRLVGSDISVHRDHARTACPGKNFVAVWPEILAGIEAQK